MKMKYVWIASVLLFSATAHAAAGGSANLCQIAYAGNQSDLFHDDLGAGNFSSGQRTMLCPLPWGTSGSSTIRSAYMNVVDNSSTSPLGCWLYLTMNGSTFWSGGRYSCSANGGCPDSTSVFTGFNTISWNQSQLGYMAQNGVLWGNIASVGYGCTMPPGNGNYSTTSWVTGYSIQ